MNNDNPILQELGHDSPTGGEDQTNRDSGGDNPILDYLEVESTPAPAPIQEPVETVQQVQPQEPENLEEEDRSIGELFSDAAVGAATGANHVVAGLGSIYGLATGDMDNFVRNIGNENLRLLDRSKSDDLRREQSRFNEKVAQEEGIVNKAMVSFTETISNPTLVGNFIFEQLPMLVATAGTGSVVGAGARVAGAGAKAVAAANVGTQVASNVALQASSVGGDTYDELEAMLEKNPGYIPVLDQYTDFLNEGMDEEQAKKALTLHLSRKSALSSAAISVLVQRLPFARTLEKSLAGVRLNPGVSDSLAARAGRGVAGGLGEGVSEALEEGGGQLAKNLSVSEIDHSKDLSEGVGEAIGQGAVGGGFGAVAGATQKRAEVDENNEPSDTPHQDALEEHGSFDGLDEIALLAEQEKQQDQEPTQGDLFGKESATGSVASNLSDVQTQGELFGKSEAPTEQKDLFGENPETLDSLLPHISQQEKLDLDSAGFLEELKNFSQDDGNYADALSQVDSILAEDDIVGLEDFEPTRVKGATSDGSKDPSYDNSDDVAIENKIPFEGFSADAQPVEQVQRQGLLDVDTKQRQEELDLNHAANSVRDKSPVQGELDLERDFDESSQSSLDFSDPGANSQSTFGQFDESVPTVDVGGTQRRVATQESVDNGPPPNVDNRRFDVERRERIAKMTPAEIESAFYKNELTGIENRRSFEERVGGAQHVVSIDADSLKAINDTMGADAGDALLRANANALEEVFGTDAFHISGDEFYVIGDDLKALEDGMAKVAAILAEAEVSAKRSDGSVITAKGLNSTFAITNDKASADEQLKKNKVELEAQGKRSPRGVIPNGVTRVNPDGTSTNLSGQQVADDTESDNQSDAQSLANSVSTPNSEVATNAEDIRGSNQESIQNEESRLNEQTGNARKVRERNDQDGRVGENSQRVPGNQNEQRNGPSESVGSERNSGRGQSEIAKANQSYGRKRDFEKQRRQNLQLRKLADKFESRSDFDKHLRDSLSSAEYARAQASGDINTAFRRSTAEKAKRRSKDAAKRPITSEINKMVKDSKGKVVHVENLKDFPVIEAFINNISGDTGRVVGAVYNNGQIFMITDNIASVDHAKQLLAHEAFHAALDNKVEGVKLRKSLDALVKEAGGTAGIKKLAKKYGVDIAPYEQFYANDSAKDHIVMEELLADIASRPSGRLRDLAMGVQKVMRKLAHIFGLKVSGNIDYSIQNLISEANKSYRQIEVDNGTNIPRASVGKTEGAYDGKGKRGQHMTNLPKTVKVDGKDVEFTGFKPAQDAAKVYAMNSGIGYAPVTSYVPVDTDRAKRIATLYENMEHKPNDPRVKSAYKKMIDETLKQFEVMLETGLTVEFNPISGADPYGNPRNATLDVVNNNHLYIFPTDEGFGTSDFKASGNPMLEPSPFMFGDKVALVNDIFRAVHDYFGHIKDGNGFRVRGEEHAWRSHASMYSPEARLAMTTETRGQNSWVNFGPHSESNQTSTASETVFADQKIGLLPEWVSEQGRSDPKASLNTDNLINSENSDRFSMSDIYGLVMTKRRSESKRKMRKVAKRYFSTTNNLTESTFDLKLLADNERSIDNRRVEVLGKEFNKGLKKVPAKKRDEARKLVNDFLSTKDADVTKLPASLREVAKAKRAYLDNLSIEIAGILQTDIDQQVEQLSDANWEQFKTYQETSGEQGVIPERLQKSLDLHRTIIGNLGRYLNRSFQAFDDPKWRGKVLKNKDLMERARDHFRSKVDKEGNQVLTENEVEGAVHAILDSAKDTGDITGLLTRGSKFGAKEVNILKHKDDSIPPVILELLGEYNDPKVNFAKSAEKMSKYVVNHNFLTNFREEGLLTGLLHHKPTVVDGEKFTVKIASDNSETMNPLNGLYTSDAIRQAMHDFVEPTNFSPFMQALMMSSGYVKYGKTVLDASVHVFNFLANMSFLVVNGHLDPREFMDAGRTLYKDISKTDSSTIEKLLRLNVIHDNPRSGELQDSVREVQEAERSITNRFGKPLVAPLKAVQEFLNTAYQAEDDFFKVVAFNSQVKKNIRAGMSETEAESHAAYRVRNGYPTYSMVPRAIIKVRQVPYIGSFPSFPWEVMRTGVNQFRFLAEDFQNDKRSAYVRLGGLITVSGAIQGAAAFSMLSLGISAEEDEELKQLGPQWSKNSTFIYTGFDNHGNPEYIDVSRYDSFDYPKRIIRAGINFKDRGLVDLDDSAFWELLSPFLGVDILAGAAYEAATNDRIGSSRPVRNEEDTAYEQMVSTVENFVKSTAPGSAIKMYNIIDAKNGGATFFGKKKVVEDEILNFIGFRKNTTDLSVSYGFRASAFRYRKTNSERILRDLVNNQNEISKEDLTNAFNRMQVARDAVYEDMIRSTEGVKRIGDEGGLDDRTIKERLSVLSKVDRAAIFNGEIPEWTPSSSFGKGMLRSALVGAKTKEDEDNLRDNYNAKMRIIRALVRERRIQRQSK